MRTLDDSVDGEPTPAIADERVLLACTVRGCGQPLHREARALLCPKRHSFDIARSGYINLLQPHDRRSPQAGDSREAVDARTRLLAAGLGAPAVEAVAERATALLSGSGTSVVDLGCGGGELLGAIAARRAITGIGIDLSIHAIESAARRYPDLLWVVANADRRLPLLDTSVTLVVSLNGRRHPSECARVLEPGGHLIVALPAADDLIELRAAVQGEAVERDRAERVIDEHRDHFTLVERTTVRDQRMASPAEIADLLTGTYRGRRTRHAALAAELPALSVTLATDILLLAVTVSSRL